MGCYQSKNIDIEFSDSSSDDEPPLELIKLYKKEEPPKTIYTKEMIRTIFREEYLRKKAGVIV